MNWISAHWQELATFVVLAVAAGYQLLRLYRTARGRHTDTGCAACPANRVHSLPPGTSRKHGLLAANRRRAPPAR